MAESLFDLFGDHLTRQAVRNVSRQPLTNIENRGKLATENRGKLVNEGPVKPNEPKKKNGEPKKTFLANTGKTLQSTPARQVFSPKVKNVEIFIDDKDREELEFTRPSRRNNDFYDIAPYHIAKHVSPPTPPPKIKIFSSEIIESDHDDFADFSIDSLPEDDLGLPDIF